MQLNHEFDKFDWCNFADIWPPLYQQLLSWQFVIPFRFLKYFILILTFLKKCSVLEKNFTFLQIHIGNYRKRGSSCSTAGLLYNEGLLLVTGLQQTGGNGFCHERSHCMKSTERNLYSRSPKCLLFESGQILSAWLQVFFLFWSNLVWDIFLRSEKIFFFENKNNHVYDTVLTSNWIFCHKHMNRWVSVCRHHQKCNCVCAVTP